MLNTFLILVIVDYAQSVLPPSSVGSLIFLFSSFSGPVLESDGELRRRAEGIRWWAETPSRSDPTATRTMRGVTWKRKAGELRVGTKQLER